MSKWWRGDKNAKRRRGAFRVEAASEGKEKKRKKKGVLNSTLFSLRSRKNPSQERGGKRKGKSMFDGCDLCAKKKGKKEHCYLSRLGNAVGQERRRKTDREAKKDDTVRMKASHPLGAQSLPGRGGKKRKGGGRGGAATPLRARPKRWPERGEKIQKALKKREEKEDEA